MRDPNNFSIFLTKLLIEPDFPCLADEIGKPRPDMNIKVTAFEESKKFYYTSMRIRARPILGLRVQYIRLFWAASCIDK